MQYIDRAAGLTGELLAFGRRQLIVPRVVDLNTIVVTQHRMLQRIIGEPIRLELQLAPDLSQVKADAGRSDRCC